MHGVLVLTASVAAAALQSKAASDAWWLQRPICRTEAQLSSLVPLLLRKVEDTSVDSAGKSAEGRCLPYSLLMQLQRQNNAVVSRERDMRAIDSVRDRVLEFAIANQDTIWEPKQQYDTLGDVIIAVSELRGWPVARDRATTVQKWAARIRNRPRDGCDAAFLFCASAAYGVRIHVHYVAAESGLLAESIFAPPRGAAIPRPSADVHVGFCDNGDGKGIGNHYVSLPNVWEG